MSAPIHSQSTEHSESVDQGGYFTLTIGEGVGEVGVDSDGRDEDSELGWKYVVSQRPRSYRSEDIPSTQPITRPCKMDKEDE